MKQKNEWKRVSRRKFNKYITEKGAYAYKISMPYLYYQSGGEYVAREEKGTFRRKYWIKF